MSYHFSMQCGDFARPAYGVLLVIILLFIPAESSAAINLTGTWQWGWHRILQNNEKTYSAGGTLRIIQKGDDFHFQLSLTAGPPGHNMGINYGRFVLHGSQGTYRNIKEKCIIYFTVINNKEIRVRQSNKYGWDSMPCYYGYGVLANGTYKLVSRNRPSVNGGGGPYKKRGPS